MSKLPVITGREMVKILAKIGFTIVGRRGSHVRMKRQRGKAGANSHRAYAS